MLKASSTAEAFEMANKLIDGDYMQDARRTERAGYDIYSATSGEYICDLGDRLEVNKNDGRSINIWIEKNRDTTVDVLSVPAKQIDEKAFYVALSNGKTIDVLQDVEYKYTDSYGNEKCSNWKWKIDGQYFDKDEYATKYLKKIISEKLTGNRIIYHARHEVPDICGCEEFLKEHANDSWGCHAQRDGRFSNLCSSCPIAEEIEANRDGVNLVYAI